MDICVSDLLTVVGIILTLFSALLATVWHMLNARIKALETANGKLHEQLSLVEGKINDSAQRQDDKRGELAGRIFDDIDKIKDVALVELRRDVSDLGNTISGHEGLMVTRKDLSEWCSSYEKGRGK